MIIACPECTSPFQVLDDQIAALVQIECPTCSFRMILDFAAANDVALREAGMQYAQGFRDEATYRQAVGGESYATTSSSASTQVVGPELHAVPEPEPEPEPTPEPEPEPVAPVAEPVRRASFTPAPTPTPVQPVQPVQPQAEPARAKPPVRARPTLIAHTAPPPVRSPQELIPQATPVEHVGHAVEPDSARPEAAIDTHVGPAPRSEVAAPVEVRQPASHGHQPVVPVDEFSVDSDEPDEPDEPVRPQPRPRPDRPDIQAEPQVRTPPHSPAPASTTKPTPDESELPAVESVETSEPPEKVETVKKGGALRTAFLMLLLLVLIGAAGLMGWSVIETQDPNPLPMLKDKFGIDLGFGIPAQPDAPATTPADTAANTAAPADATASDKSGT